MTVHATLDGDGAYLCGGTELLQVMKMGLMQVGHLIDLKRVPELRGINEVAGRLEIGAAMTHGEIERSAVTARALPELVHLERHVANVRVRNIGTLGGNLAFAEPHSDPATLLVALGATVQVVGPGRTRELQIGDLILGPLTTALEPGEILVRIRIPAVGPDTLVAYRKIAFHERPAVSVAIVVTMHEGVMTKAQVVVGSVADAPAAVPRAAQALDGAPVHDWASALADAARIVSEDVEAFDDLNGSADYKRHLAAVLVDRAGTSAFGRLVHG